MLKINNLNKSYKKKKALVGINIEIEKGSFVGLVGNNGAGKTTLIKSIFGETNIESGEILFNKEDVNKNGNISKISFFPDSNSLKLNIKLIDYLNYIAVLNEVEDRENKIKKIIKFLKLDPHSNKELSKLSAGWKKRAIMASCLITSPEMIIFDEPTANLDLDSKIEFLEIIKYLNTIGVTIVITSHIIEELQGTIDHLIILREGVVIYNQSFDKDNEIIKEIYSNLNKHEETDFNELQNLFK
ncbi:ABC transporter ATP-binding protein [Spiroplasma endosymbiont of Othius punctulatus]|uniref:ABC transporter ATP-binding protein n=1 Tax=Spiroplasma endosymbiont of Othius punctulatus TaxID=3066289 RepID=UPI0030CBD135